MLGFLQKDKKSRTYSPSARLLHLGTSYLRGHPLVERATPYLLLAQARTKSPFSLVELLDTQVIYVARVPGLSPTNLQIELGSQTPAYCTAAGKAILAFLPENEAKQIIARSELRAYTPFTITDPSKILRELKKIRTVGFAVSNQEYLVGDVSIAAPVFRDEGIVIGAVITGLKASDRSSAQLRAKVGPVVLDTAQLISGLGNSSRVARVTNLA
jgi:DNA-binding IclR family transcriptional regulator